MTISEFESYLQKGLGRAILLLREEADKEPFREAVWNHALHEPRYDGQCNEPRGHYIKELFDCFPDGDAMLSELFRFYGEGKGDPQDRWYYIDNVFDLASERVEGAEASLDSLYHTLLEELLTLSNPLTDGRDRERDSYLFAAKRRYRLHRAALDELVRDGIALLQKSERYDITFFTDFFDNDIRASKTEEFQAILTSLENEDPTYNAIIEDYRKESEEVPKRWGPPKEDTFVKPTNWREAIDYAIQKGQPKIPVNKSFWQNLSAEDGAEIARLAEEESDPERRFVLLWQMCHYGEELLRQYPRDPLPLIAELESNTHITFPYTSENQLLWIISRVVAKINHPAVREFALRSLPHYAGKHNSISFDCTVEALINNFQPEDSDTLAAFVTSVTDSDMLHAIGVDIIYPAINPLIPESVLLYLYENEPCSSCRNRVFLSLMARYGDMTNLPEPLASIRKEAQLDCDYGTRLIARGQSIRKGEV